MVCNRYFQAAKKNKEKKTQLHLLFVNVVIKDSIQFLLIIQVNNVIDKKNHKLILFLMKQAPMLKSCVNMLSKKFKRDKFYKRLLKKFKNKLC